MTVTQTKADGVVTAYGDEDSYGDALSAPDTSNLNYRGGQTVANLVIVPVGANGEVDLHNNSTGTVQMAADVEGYFSADQPETPTVYYSTTPTRVLDTRKGIGTGKVVELNITAVGGTRSGYITASVTARTRRPWT